MPDTPGSVETSTLTSASFEDLARELIVRLGEDPTREGLIRTPERMRRAYEYLVKGYREDAEAMLKEALFTVTYDEMVIVKDVEMFSLCEHHMLPFFGKVHVAYIPNGKVIGLSKIPRLIDIFARRLQIPIMSAAKQVHSGRGVLLLYGNYSGDILNFDVAAEELMADGIEVVTGRISDDGASAPRERRQERRGVAGDIFVVKVAGAAAEELLDLQAVAAAAEKANERTSSMGVALTSCIIPASGKPIFQIRSEEMEDLSLGPAW